MDHIRSTEGVSTRRPKHHVVQMEPGRDTGDIVGTREPLVTNGGVERGGADRGNAGRGGTGRGGTGRGGTAELTEAR